MSYKPHQSRDAMAFDILQNTTPETAQAFFWNFKSRTQRREAILAWKADQEMNKPFCDAPGCQDGTVRVNYEDHWSLEDCRVCKGTGRK